MNNEREYGESTDISDYVFKDIYGDINVDEITPTKDDPFFLPPHTRFSKHPTLDIVQRRVIIGESVYLLTVSSSKWNRTISNLVSKWIRKNRIKVILPFIWGVMKLLPNITPDMLLENRCEKCNAKLSCYRHKVRHMSMNVCAELMSRSSIDLSGNVVVKTEKTDTNISVNDTGNVVNILEQNNYIIQNNIQIRDFGKENPAWLTSNLLHFVMNNVEKAIPHLMAKKHFNDEFPENKNLRISNVRDINKRLQIYHGGRWAIRDSKQTFYQVLVDIYDILSDALSSDEDDETIADEIRTFRESDRFMKKIGRIRPIWERFRQKLQNDDKDVMNDLWEDLKTLLLDRQLAIEQGFE